MILDSYFKRPVFWDYAIAFIISLIIYYFSMEEIICLPDSKRSLSIASDLSNIGLTSTGFILTLLTVLITFKSSSRTTKENYSEDSTLFELFFASDLYLMTTDILKNCIKSLIFISILGYILKLSLNEENLIQIFYYNILAIIIITFSLWRCLMILNKTLNMQR